MLPRALVTGAAFVAYNVQAKCQVTMGAGQVWTTCAGSDIRCAAGLSVPGA